MMLAAAASLSAIVYAGTPVNVTDLPKASQTFLTKYFPGDKVTKAEKDQGRHGVEYEVDLTGGAEVEFTDKGDWKEVKAAKGKKVPADIVPVAIAKHVTANHAGQDIVEISRKRGGYKIKLSDGTEIKLTEDAKPLPARQGGHGGKGGGRGPRH